MKTNKFITACLLLVMMTQAQSVKKSSFMVMPSEDWMFQHGYSTKESLNGQVKYIPDYDRAFNEDEQLKSVTAKIVGEFKMRGVEKVSTYSGRNTANSFTSTYNALNTKATVKTSSLDKFLQTSPPDVLIEVFWQVPDSGPKKKISNFRLDVTDPYSGQAIASVEGKGVPSFEADISVLLKEAINDKIDPLLNEIQRHVDDCYTNGRKITINIVKDDSWSGDFDNEFEGKELKEIIEGWLVDNAVKGSAEPSINSGQDQLSFDVRIPMLDERQRGMNAESFIKPLVAKLRAAPYNIPNKAKGIKLGLAQITLGVNNK